MPILGFLEDNRDTANKCFNPNLTNNLVIVIVTVFVDVVVDVDVEATGVALY